MFAKDKVTQSMIDAVNKVIGQKVEEEKKPEQPQKLSEAESLKIPTSTGTRVYGHRYGNAAKAHKDQTKHSVDDVKEPTKKDIEKDSANYKTKGDYNKERYSKPSVQAYFAGDHKGGRKTVKEDSVEEAAKPDFLDMDKDGNKKESMKKAISDKKAVSETVRRSDIPAFIRKAKGEKPLTPAEVKAPKSDTRSHSDNLAKARANEEVVNENYEEIKVHSKDGKHIGTITHGKYQSVAYAHPTTKFGATKEPHPDEDSTTLAGPHDTQKGIDFIHAHHRMMNEGVIDKVKGLFKKKEKSTNLFDQPHVKKDIKAYLKKSAKYPTGPNNVKNIMAKEEVTEEQLDEMLNEVLSKDASAGDWIHDFVHSDNPKFAGKSKAERKKMALGAYYAKQNEEKGTHEDEEEEAEDIALIKKMVKKSALKEEDLDEALKGNQHKIDANHNNKIDGQDFKLLRAKKKVQESESKKDDNVPFDKPYTTSKGNIKDKSGAVHTPMSRARDLARQAFKKIKNETMMGKAGTTSESKKKW